MGELELIKVDENFIKAAATDGSVELTFEADLISDFKKILLVHLKESNEIELGFGDTEEAILQIVDCYQENASFFSANLDQLA